MEKITPFLWFNNNLEEAIRFYTSIFDNSKVHMLTPMSATFELDGQKFHGLNGGPMFSFTPAISFFVNCETQEEIDDKWERLAAGGGRHDRCGWLQDKFGVSWQIVPPILGKYLNDADREKAQRVMDAMMKMTKLDISLLQKAYDGN